MSKFLSPLINLFSISINSDVNDHFQIDRARTTSNSVSNSNDPVQSHSTHHIFLALSVVFLILLSGCASRGAVSVENNSNQQVSDKDPLEKVNRVIYWFNSKADKYVLKPATKAYKKITPDPVENGVSNFFVLFLTFQHVNLFTANEIFEELLMCNTELYQEIPV